MKYYKAMNKDMSCRGFQYEIGKTYNLRRNQNLELCKRGFHFCDILTNCFNYYTKGKCIICEVEPLGRIIHSENKNKLVTDKIKIVRQLSDEEIEKEQYIIQDGIEMIGRYCFAYCNDLKEVIIPAGVTCISNYCFAYCNDLKEVTIPASVTCIGYGAFWGCKSLENINLSNSVTYIGKNAFYNCTSLKSISISLKSISIPNAFNYIDDFAFYGCKNLEKIYVPKDFDINIFNTHRINGKIKLLDRVEIVRIEKERK